jgi:hypothetical protein
VWDLETGACLCAWLGGSPFRALASGDLRPNGCVRIAAGCENGSVHFFELMPPGPPKNRAVRTAWHPARPLIAGALDTGAITIYQWHASAGHLEELAHAEPAITPIASLRFSTDGTCLQVRGTDGAERILDAATLQPAALPSCLWADPRDLSPDGAWRTDLERGRVEVVPVKETE